MEQEPMQGYLARIGELLQTLLSHQEQAFAAAVECIAGCIEQDKLVHLFGTGHSHMLVEEGFYRAGGLANVNPWLEPSLMLHAGGRSSTAMERLPGIGQILLDKYAPSPGDALLIFSNSGVNAVPVEVALGARQRQITVIAVTSRDYSLSLEPRHSSGKRLLQLADIVIDNQLPPGDAVIEIPGVTGAIGPGSTIIGAAILNAVLVGAVDAVVRRGVQPPVYISANMPGAAEHNLALTRRFAGRVRHL